MNVSMSARAQLLSMGEVRANRTISEQGSFVHAGENQSLFNILSSNVLLPTILLFVWTYIEFRM
ncbi:hypothetical protein [Pseudoalteromonas byunsanensis]|uniref:Uncharacterized protein n=1 Tax=Pseudoalteromonas byunsanensis TaxID=327939 RepID=A0A1S1N677_9GAMM|nr:hypothetical protein [Pseudoalteromonas byunsanensis]OHU96647.1 hypothetical protein BIW53_04790 [Pseudoalteromonas byunsanensis]